MPRARAMAGNWRTKLLPSRDANGRWLVILIPEKSATMTSAAAVPAMGFAVRARATNRKAGLVLENCHSGTEPVNGTFVRVLDMLAGPVAESGA